MLPNTGSEVFSHIMVVLFVTMDLIIPKPMLFVLKWDLLSRQGGQVEMILNLYNAALISNLTMSPARKRTGDLARTYPTQNTMTVIILKMYSSHAHAQV